MPISFLTAVELFRGISEAEAQRVARLCAERRHRRGTTIFSKDDSSDSVYILREGRVRLVSYSGKGTETILHLLKPDAIFGELLLSEERRALTAVAATDVAITSISKENFLELLSTVPTIAKNFIRLLSRRLAKVERGFAEFGHSWSYHRLAQVLLQLCDEHGQETPQGFVIPLRLTHEDLANLIGTTRETVTTQLNRFKRMRLISRQDRHLVVNKARLRRFLQAEEEKHRGLAPP